MIQLNPATRILLWLIFAISVPHLSFPETLVFGILLIVMLIRSKTSELLRQLQRIRWLLLSLLLVYAVSTPGDALLPTLGIFSPTREGLQSGLLQSWRLALIVIALSVLFSTTSWEQLLGGLYLLLRPLGILGIDAGRIAARIWLTINYTRRLAINRDSSLRQELQKTLEPEPADYPIISLPLEMLTWRDLAAIALMVTLMGYLSL